MHPFESCEKQVALFMTKTHEMVLLANSKQAEIWLETKRFWVIFDLETADFL
jgi:hypothetical protein